MIKLKTKKSAKKRVNIKKNSYYRKKTNKAHLLANKNSTRLRRLSRITRIHFSNLNLFKKLVPILL